MQTLGLSASYPLKAVFLTHGHGDHDGGAKWLLDNLGARSYIGSADAAGKTYAPITIDSAEPLHARDEHRRQDLLGPADTRAHAGLDVRRARGAGLGHDACAC
jgi:glyoxylase-like metal-dependent hydrolase (beta-lactamase superfamily II)